MRLHFPSLVIGVAAVSMILVSMSQSSVPAAPPRVEYGPNPKDMVQIREGTPYVVPTGRLFVLTGLGTKDVTGNSAVNLLINGQQELAGGLFDGSAIAGYSSLSTVAAVPVGFTVAAGSTIEIVGGSPSAMRGRAWGYLANQ